MTPLEYQKLALRTMPSTDPVKAGLHGTLGLCSEIAELEQAISTHDSQEHIVKELGDCWWMIAEIATANNIRMDNVIFEDEEHHRHVRPVAETAGDIAGYYQKTFQGHEIKRSQLTHRLREAAVYLINKANELALPSTEDIWQINIDKLLARYPDGFDPEKSLHRAKGDI